MASESKTANQPQKTSGTDPARYLDVYLTEAEFCSRYRVRPRTAQRWRTTGQGPPWVRLGARRVLYRSSDCESWAASRTFAHRAAELARVVMLIVGVSSSFLVGNVRHFVDINTPPLETVVATTSVAPNDSEGSDSIDLKVIDEGAT